MSYRNHLGSLGSFGWLLWYVGLIRGRSLRLGINRGRSVHSWCAYVSLGVIRGAYLSIRRRL